MTAGRAQAHRRRAGLPLVLPAGRALQPRRRGPRQPAPHRPDRPGRGHRDQPAGRRVRPAGLRQRQPRGDGRRPQVGADRAGVVQEPAAPPQRQDDGRTRAPSWTTRSPRLHHSAWRMGRMLKDHLKIFQIETTLNNDVFPAPYDFLHEARVGVVGAATRPRMLAAASRARAARRSGCGTSMFHDMRAPYGLTGVHAGETEAVHERTIAKVHRAAAGRGAGPERRAGAWACPTSGPTTSTRSMNPILADLHGAGLLLQLLPRPARRPQGRRGDPLPPARTRASTSCTTRATSTSTRRSWPSRPTRR